MTNQIVIEPVKVNTHKKAKLFFGLLFDFIGLLSYLIPFIGEFSDIVWAPAAAVILKSMYRGTIGTVGGIIAFIEEIVPGLDFIPTFTLTWIYTYYFSGTGNIKK